MKDIMLLVQKCAHAFSFYDLDSGQAIQHLMMPNYPHELAVDHQRKHAYIGIFGIETAWTRGEQGDHRVAVVDIVERKQVHMLDGWPCYRPHGLACDREGRLYVMSEGSDVLMTFDDPTRQVAPNIAVPSGGIKTHLFALNADASVAWGVHLLSNTVTRFHPRDATVVPRAVMPGPRPEGNALSKDERLLFVANRGDDTLVEIDSERMTVGRRARTRRDPNRVYRHDAPDGSELLLLTNSGDRSLSVFDTSSLKEVECLTLPANPTALSFHPDGSRAYVSFQDDFVRELNLRTWRFEREIRTLREPDSSFVLSV